MSTTTPVQLGELTLYEPWSAHDPVGPWVGRDSGSVDLILVDRLAHAGELVEPDVTHLAHPSLQTLIHRRYEGGVLCQLREAVLGVRLSDLLRRLRERSELVPLSVFRAWTETILQGLLFLEDAVDHSGRPMELRHLQLDPRTVWITFWGQPKLCDYDLLRPRRDRVAGLRTGGSADIELPGDGGPARDAADLATLMYVCLTCRASPAGAGPSPRPDAPAPLVAQLTQWVRDGIRPVPRSIREVDQRLRPLLHSLPRPEGDSEIAHWLRARASEEEGSVLALLHRVRQAQDGLISTATRLTPNPAMTDPPWGEALAPEPPEPSVLTMPGALLAPGRRMASTPDTETTQATVRPVRRTWAAAGGVSVLASVGALVWAMARPPAVESLATAPELTPLPAAPRARAPEPELAPLAEAAAETEVPRSPSPSKSRVSKRRSRAAARVVAPGGSLPASPPKEPVPAAEAAPVRPTRYARVDALVTKAERDPSDAAAFEAAVAALMNASQGLDAEAQGRVQRAVRRAELSWSVQDLRRALRRLRQAGR